MTKKITQEEAEEILAEYESEEAELEVEGGSIKIETGTEVTFEFVSLREDPEIVFRGDDAWATVSKYLIHRGDETLEVDTEGPFELNIEGFEIDDTRQ